MESTQDRIAAKRRKHLTARFFKDFWTGLVHGEEDMKPGLQRLLWNGIPLVMFIVGSLYLWSRH